MTRRRYVEAPWGQIHVAVAGPASGRPVLLLAQTPRSWDEYREVMEELDDEFLCVAVDHPGMGASDAHPDGATIEAYAASAALVLREVGSPALVCGHHTGGVVAVEVAAAAPELVSGLILSSTPWVDDKARAARARKDPIDTVVIGADGSHLSSLWFQRAPYYPDGEIGTSLLDRFVADALKCADPADGHHAVGAYRMEDRAPLISCPVTIVEHGADPFASPHTARIKQQFPSATIEKIPEGVIPLEYSACDVAATIRTAASLAFNRAGQQTSDEETLQ